MKGFYNDRMNVVTKVEPTADTVGASGSEPATEWRYNTCSDVSFE